MLEWDDQDKSEDFSGFDNMLTCANPDCRKEFPESAKVWSSTDNFCSNECRKQDMKNRL